jgi:hypothetical protein
MKMITTSLTIAVLAVAFAATPSFAGRQAAKAAPAATIDINNASQADLEKLPGVGASTAKKIVAGRPYAAIADLSKAGLSAKVIKEITPLVTVGAVATPPVAKVAGQAAPETPAPAKAPAAGKATAASETVAAVPPVKGMVWVNLNSKVFHREGDRYYGKTKNGKFMIEADAVKAGYREAKPGGAAKK